MVEHASTTKCKLMRQQASEESSDVVKELDNPLDKSDSFHLDTDNVGRRPVGAFYRNIYESNDNNNTVSIQSRSTNVSDVSSETDEVSGNTTRSSGFLHVNNQPFLNVTGVDPLTDVGEDPTSPSDVGISSAGPLHLPKFGSREEKSETFRSIKDQFKSIKEVSQAMRDEGVTECNLIVGNIFTKLYLSCLNYF